MANSIGHVAREFFNRVMVLPFSEGTLKEPFDRAARAVALHVLDLMAAAGVTPAEAAAQLRAGKTIEDICAVAGVERSTGFNPPKIVIGPPGCGGDGCVKPFGHDGMCVDSTGQARITKEWLAKGGDDGR